MPKQVSASDAKNNFGGLLDDVAALGRVEIVKHGRLVAVMFSPRALDSFVAAGPGDERREARWGENHMIPPARAAAARMVRAPGAFDEDES